MAGGAGRIVRGCIGFAIIAWGYNSYQYPFNLAVITLGAIVLIASVFNLLIVAPLFGYSISGNKIIDKHGPVTGVPGEDVSGIDELNRRGIIHQG